MLFFTSRDKARKFAKGVKKVTDMGASSPNGKRWGVSVIITEGV